ARALLGAMVEGIAKRYPMNASQFGVSIVDAASGRALESRLADTEFAPASNFKLLVGATALAYLGPRFRYTTALVARGTIAAGTLQGDLILVGGGDPLLSRDDLRAAVQTVAQAGIRRIAGSVLADASLFDGQRYGGGWAWDDMPYYYQPPIDALAVDEGTVGVTVNAGKAAGSTLTASIEPNGGAMTLAVTGVTSPVKGLNDVDCFRSPGLAQITVVGHYPLNKSPTTFRCAVNDSAAYTAGVFRQLLSDAGISAGQSALGALPQNVALDVSDRSAAPPDAIARYPGAALLWTHDSPPLNRIIAAMMPPSDNFIAEHLMKMLPVAALHERGSFDGGAQVERKFIASLGLDPRTIDNGDGSGLSQGDRITPRDLTTILRWETRSSSGKDLMFALGRPGISGTVKRHLRGTDAVGRVWAKDGYIWHVSTFSGYAFTRHHGLVIFSIMFNNAVGLLRPFQRAQDQIVKTIVDMP
ncbi:MAG: D-alanyl-D-alanine carboxypeptidase/D-alanyl-D-alanine-endopeptidase, partial [Candidatus Eremiobacteraeota bacterium]|nr:D-alanyl-D-alanine carboxypeptidase/D-alanyl-D-alanine-endopeptidase [Candidatus Eremiobacteraeota bacterium]